MIDADADSARSCLQKMAERMRTSEIDPATVAALKAPAFGGTLGKFVADPATPLHRDAILLATLWMDPAASKAVIALAKHAAATDEERQLALATLVSAKDPTAISIAADMLARRDDAARPLQLGVLTALSRSEDPAIASLVLAHYPQLAPDSQAQALELLTQRVAWSKPLLSQIAADKIPRTR